MDISTKQSIMFILIVRLMFFCALLKAEDDDLETKVKAAYIFNFTKFVEWGDFSGETLNICVVGENRIAAILREIASRNRGRPFRVEQDKITDLKECQVLYIDRSDATLSELVAKARRTAVLTVSDAKNFAKNGGVIGFYMDDGKVKLEINPKIAEACNLKISSKLMEVARIVN
ncbi:MAG: YfiR family protein [Gammaproteobacteria bacterium]